MTELKWNCKTFNAQFESMLNCWCRENFCSICVKSIRGYGNQISGRGEHLMRRLMRIVGLYPAFQPSSDHSVAPWGGALLKSTICSSAAFRCASISRRALCHSLTQKTLRWGYVWINGFSTSSEEERGQHMSQTFINSFPKRIFVLIFWLLLFTPSKNKWK